MRTTLTGGNAKKSGQDGRAPIPHFDTYSETPIPPTGSAGFQPAWVKRTHPVAYAMRTKPFSAVEIVRMAHATRRVRRSSELERSIERRVSSPCKGEDQDGGGLNTVCLYTPILAFPLAGGREVSFGHAHDVDWWGRQKKRPRWPRSNTAF